MTGRDADRGLGDGMADEAGRPGAAPEGARESDPEPQARRRSATETPTTVGRPDADDPLLGVRVGPYEILSHLGEGAFGCVYLARDVGLDRKAAIKFLRTPTEYVAKSLFEREAVTLARASQHPNVVQIYHFSEHLGKPYFALELVMGSAKSLIENHSDGLPVLRALKIAEQCADGLHFAHEQGILHRDIKPANILIRPGDSTAKIADFGLARFYDATTTLTGGNAGTPAYMSPEQSLGEELDRRSDIFSLGIVLFELLCGKRPFDGSSTRELKQRIEAGRHPSLRDICPGLPADAVRVVERALQVRREDRFQTALEMAEAIRDVRIGLEGKRRIRAKRWWVVGPFAVGALVTAAFFVFLGSPQDFSPLPFMAASDEASRFREDSESQRLALAAGLTDALRAPPEVLAHTPGYERYLAGLEFLRKGLASEAVPAFEEARRLSPSETNLLGAPDYLVSRELAAAVIQRGAYEEAIDLCKLSYNTVPTERALHLIRRASSALWGTGNTLDSDVPTVNMEAVQFPTLVPHRKRASSTMLRVQGSVRDDFLIAELSLNNRRMLPPTLARELNLDFFTAVSHRQPSLRVQVRDFRNPSVVCALELQGDAEPVEERFHMASSDMSLSTRLCRTFARAQRVCYAAEDGIASSTSANGTTVSILSPQSGDAVYREEVLLDWVVRAQSAVESVRVDGEEQLVGAGRGLAQKGAAWLPVETGPNTLRVAGRSARDPVSEYVEASVAVSGEMPPAISEGDTYLASPASRPSVMVLAFETANTDRNPEALRAQIETALSQAGNGRFSVRYLSSLEGSLPESQRERSLRNQEAAVRAAKYLPCDLVICGGAVGYEDGVEVAAKILDARSGALIAARAAYITVGQDGDARLAELAEWLADALPRLMGLVGATQPVAAGEGRQLTVFATNLGSEVGLCRGQHVSVFRRHKGTLWELARARVAKVDSPYSLCVTTSEARTRPAGIDDLTPREGDLILVR